MQTTKQFWMKGFTLPAIALCSFLLSGNAANAALVTYSFTGSVSTLSETSRSPKMNLNARLTGSFQFENATGVGGGDYPSPVARTTVIIGGYTSSFATRANAVASFSEF